MWRQANLRRWVRGVRRNPGPGCAGFAAGLLYGVAVTYSGLKLPPSAPVRFFAWHSAIPIVTVICGVALLIWMAGTYRLPHKRGTIFVACIFPGAMVGLLLTALVGAITRTIA